jgi:hypothetical protein
MPLAPFSTPRGRRLRGRWRRRVRTVAARITEQARRAVNGFVISLFAHPLFQFGPHLFLAHGVFGIAGEVVLLVRIGGEIVKFTRLFRLMIEMTPTEYRRMRKG